VEAGLDHCLCRTSIRPAREQRRVRVSLLLLQLVKPSACFGHRSSSGQSHALCTSAPCAGSVRLVTLCLASTLHQCLLLGPRLDSTNQLVLSKAQMWLQGQTKWIGPCQVWLPGVTQHNLPRGSLHPRVSLCDSMLRPNAHPQFHHTPLLHFRADS